MSNAVSTITTLFLGGSAYSGVMFDVKSQRNDLTIVGLDLHTTSTRDEITEVWSKPGSWMNYDTSPIHWTMYSCGTIEGQGYFMPTMIPDEIMSYIQIPGGEIAGLYTTFVDGGGNLQYGYGSSFELDTGDVYTENDDIAILVGAGKSYLFGEVTFDNRLWNGNMRYVNDLIKRENQVTETDCRPSRIPTIAPVSITSVPTLWPSINVIPSLKPTMNPTNTPTSFPSYQPSILKSSRPSDMPSIYILPSFKPTDIKTISPTVFASLLPSIEPSVQATETLTLHPTLEPSSVPSFIVLPQIPTEEPSQNPSMQPSSEPSILDTNLPTLLPSQYPTAIFNTDAPHGHHSKQPVIHESLMPTMLPSKASSIEFSSQEPSMTTDFPSVRTSFPSFTKTSIPQANPISTPSTTPTISYSSSPSFPSKTDIPVLSFSSTSEAEDNLLILPAIIAAAAASASVSSVSAARARLDSKSVPSKLNHSSKKLKSQDQFSRGKKI